MFFLISYHHWIPTFILWDFGFVRTTHRLPPFKDEELKLEKFNCNESSTDSINEHLGSECGSPQCNATPFSSPAESPPTTLSNRVSHLRSLPIAKSCSLPSDCPLLRLAQLDDGDDVEVTGSRLAVVGPPLTNESASISALTVTTPSPDSFRRAHRHSIPGHRLNNYLKFLNELAAKGSSTAHLFSTAVISGSSSAPNLKEMPQSASGCGESGPWWLKSNPQKGQMNQTSLISVAPLFRVDNWHAKH